MPQHEKESAAQPWENIRVTQAFYDVCFARIGKIVRKVRDCDAIGPVFRCNRSNIPPPLLRLGQLVEIAVKYAFGCAHAVDSMNRN